MKGQGNQSFGTDSDEQDTAKERTNYQDVGITPPGVSEKSGVLIDL